MDQIWQVNGTPATVTFFDQGNGWTSIHDAQTENDDNNDNFTDALWDQILNKVPNHHQHRGMLARAIDQCEQNGDCQCPSQTGDHADQLTPTPAETHIPKMNQHHGPETRHHHRNTRRSPAPAC